MVILKDVPPAGNPQPYIVLRPHSVSDPDGSRTAQTLQAYVTLAEARAFRKLLCRRLVLLALVAWLLEATTPGLSRIGLAASLAFFTLIGAAAALGEWRAEKRLSTLISQTSTHE